MSSARAQIRWNGWGWAAHRDPLAERDAIWRWLARLLGMPALLATPARALDTIVLTAPRLDREALAGFGDILGPDRVRRDDAERAFHARGRSYHDLLRLRAGDLSSAPDAVLYPRGEDEVLAVLRLAAERAMGVVPFGGGTAGGVAAGPGCVTLDLSGMARVTRIDTVAGIAKAEAGIYGPALEHALGQADMTLGHFPRSFEFSTLGGWIATCGMGADSGRGAGDWLSGLRVATPGGMLVCADTPAGAAGPDLRRMMLGSEGTLGVITQAQLRVRPRMTTQDCAYVFEGFAAGLAAVRQAAREGLAHVMLRLSDGEATRFDRALEENSGRLERWPRKFAERGIADPATLIAVFPDRAAARRFATIARAQGGRSLGEGPVAAWRAARFAAPYLRDSLLDRGVGMETLETAARWSKLPALRAAVTGVLEAAMRRTAPHPDAHGVVLTHAGPIYPDGAGLCFTVIFPRLLDDETGQWQTIARDAWEAIMAHGGSIARHQGVGEDRLGWVVAEKGALGIAALRGMKQALDPAGILNPGKLIPPAGNRS